MKKYLLVAATLLILAAPSYGWCQGGTSAPSAPSSPPTPPANTGGPAAQKGGQFNPNDPAQFQQRKADILKHMGEHIADMQQRQSCVQAANDQQALMACMPHMMQGRPMMGGGPMPGGPGMAGGMPPTGMASHPGGPVPAPGGAAPSK